MEATARAGESTDRSGASGAAVADMDGAAAIASRSVPGDVTAEETLSRAGQQQSEAASLGASPQQSGVEARSAVQASMPRVQTETPVSAIENASRATANRLDMRRV
jgi:hypothetical protein